MADSNPKDERYAFQAEIYDREAELSRRYLLSFYTADNSVEMFDLKRRCSFLKRTVYKGISEKDLHVGASVTIYARQLKIVDYADAHTRRLHEAKKSRTLAVVTPDAYNSMGKIIQEIIANDFIIAKMQMVKFTQQDVDVLFAEGGAAASSGKRQLLTSDVSVAMELVREDAVSNLNRLARGANVDVADSSAPAEPSSLAGRFGTPADQDRQGIFASPNTAAAQSHLQHVFGRGLNNTPTTALFNNCTCAVIRPHAMKNAGDIVDAVLGEGFEISAMRMLSLDKMAAEEFLEVYKGVLPEFNAVVNEMLAGPCLALEIRQENVVGAFRELVGPWDPAIAKHLRPKTLRGRFGLNRAQNAIHCTDLPEDGLLESEYMFKMLWTDC